MIITYHGAQMIKITSGDFTVVFNPISKESKLKPVRFGADLVLISRNLPEFNGVESVTRKEKTPFVINGPGEYETKGVFIKGVGENSSYNTEGINTIYTLNMDDMNIVHLGAQTNPKPDLGFMEDMDELDIVFVPIGGQGVLDAQEAYKLAVSLAPKIIIPVHYDMSNKEDALKAFESEAVSLMEKIDKLTIKKKDLQPEGFKVVVLNK